MATFLEDLKWWQIFLFFGVVFGVVVYTMGWNAYKKYVMVHWRVSAIVIVIGLVIWYFFFKKKPNTGTLDDDDL